MARPALPPVNASPASFRAPTHDSGPPWVASPSMSDFLLPYSMPVYPGAPRQASPLRNSFPQAVYDGLDRHALLVHRVALADRHLTVGQRVEVHCDAERRPDLVLAPVAPADVAAGLVVLGAEAGPQQALHLARDLDQLVLLGP